MKCHSNSFHFLIHTKYLVEYKIFFILKIIFFLKKKRRIFITGKKPDTNKVFNTKKAWLINPRQKNIYIFIKMRFYIRSLTTAASRSFRLIIRSDINRLIDIRILIWTMFNSIPSEINRFEINYEKRDLPFLNVNTSFN
jgi:hypothetical protein